MAFTGDYTDEYPPWGRRKRVVPLKTYSGKVVYIRKRHPFSISDAERILRSIVPPDNPPLDWQRVVIQSLRKATSVMMDKILFFLDSQTVSEIQYWIEDLVSRSFGFLPVDEDKMNARRLIRLLADRAGLEVTIR